MMHELKVWPTYFEAIMDGSKTFEVRLSDRNYNAGDTLHLREYDPATKGYTGREITVEVTYKLGGPMTVPGFDVMAIRVLETGSVPTKPGWYWAKWKQTDDDVPAMYNYASATNPHWDVIEVVPDYNDGRTLVAHIAGVPGSHTIDGFFFGPAVRKPPQKTTPQIENDNKRRAALQRYQSMTPDQREEFLQTKRREETALDNRDTALKRMVKDARIDMLENVLINITEQTQSQLGVNACRRIAEALPLKKLPDWLRLYR